MGEITANINIIDEEHYFLVKKIIKNKEHEIPLSRTSPAFFCLFSLTVGRIIISINNPTWLYQ
jgi:hypothetical protein